MKCDRCGLEMAFLGTVNLETRGDMPNAEIRFDECEDHGIQMNHFGKPRAYPERWVVKKRKLRVVEE